MRVRAWFVCAVGTGSASHESPPRVVVRHTQHWSGTRQVVGCVVGISPDSSCWTEATIVGRWDAWLFLCVLSALTTAMTPSMWSVCSAVRFDRGCAGTSVQATAFAVLCFAFALFHDQHSVLGVIGVTAVLVFILAWNCSWAPLMFVVCSELLPAKVGT